jgi:hypothetical protein
MTDRYQEGPFPTNANHDRGASRRVRGESDLLAGLAQLIGQTDPFGTPARRSLPLQSRANVRPQHAPAEQEPGAPAGPPPWRQRARQEGPPQQEYEEPEPSPVYPLHRPAVALEQDYHELQQDADEQSADSSRYDDALDGPIKSVEQENAGVSAYPDDAYAYQRGYEEESKPRTRRLGMVTVAAALALAVVGTGAALTYRTYVGSPRSGETPIIRADISQTKVMPVQSDGVASKIPDRMPPSDGGEKLVSREEAPVDVDARFGAPRVELPPLNQSSSAPPVASISPAVLVTAANGTMPNNEPRKIKPVKSDAENGGIPAGAAAPAKPDPAARSASTPIAQAQRNPNASANAPLTLSSQSAPASDPAPPIRLAATNTVQAASSAGGGYLVQVSSQKNEADVQASYRALQSKFPAALGSRPPVIKRADLGDKGVYYRTMVGPFGSSEEAAQFCGKLKSAGGQCVVQKN